MLEVEHEQHVQGRERDAPDERHAEQQIERDRRAEHLGKIAGRNGNLADNPQKDRRPARIAVAAGLREVAPAGDPQTDRHRLQQDRHQVGDHDDAHQRLAEACAAGEVSGPVARVHVADGHQIAGAREGEELSPEPRRVRDRNRSVNLGEANVGGGGSEGHSHQARLAEDECPNARPGLLAACFSVPCRGLGSSTILHVILITQNIPWITSDALSDLRLAPIPCVVATPREPHSRCCEPIAGQRAQEFEENQLFWLER